MEIPIDFLAPYIKDKKKKHQFYHESCQFYYDLKIHMDGMFPDKLLTERRPAESITIRDYRKQIYVPITQAPVHKVHNSLLKIRKAPDWSIKYDLEDQPKSMPEEESFHDYMEEDYPYYSSFTNWFFSVAFKNYEIDANAVILMMPLNPVKEDVDYYNPFPTVFNSDQVIDFKEGEFYVLLSKEKCDYKDGNDVTRKGFIYYVVTETNIYQYNQIKTDGTYLETLNIEHNLGFLPIVKMYGDVFDSYGVTCLYTSRIAPIVPSLKEAVREYSDLQAEIVQHIHSTIIAYQQQQCNSCKGIGFVKVGDGAPIQCQACTGSGYMAFNPYEHIVVRPQQAGEQPYPTPIAQYLIKPIDIAKLQDERVRNHIKDALTAINFEFLYATPLNQSGRAKEVDRSELNNFVYTICEDVIRIFDACYAITYDYRYGGIDVLSEEDREKVLPKINVPCQYDIVSESVLLAEITSAKAAGVEPVILNSMLQEYTNSKFNSEQDIRDLVMATLELDPFSSKKEEDILLQLNNDGILESDYIIHCNIISFVSRAIEENKDFLNMSCTEKIAVMNEYATELKTQKSTKNEIMKQIQPSISISERL